MDNVLCLFNVYQSLFVKRGKSGFKEEKIIERARSGMRNMVSVQNRFCSGFLKRHNITYHDLQISLLR